MPLAMGSGKREDDIPKHSIDFRGWFPLLFAIYQVDFWWAGLISKCLPPLKSTQVVVVLCCGHWACIRTPRACLGESCTLAIQSRGG